MRFDIITIFPQILNSYFSESILRRAQEKGLIKIKIHNLRDFTTDKHKTVDDKPYGGGPGMVMQLEPIIKAISSILNPKSNPSAGGLNPKQIQKSKLKKIQLILFSPAGKQFDNKTAISLAKNYDQLIFICGRYEGVDERVKKVVSDLGFRVLNLSVGPYVLTGGEIPAMVVIDAVSRQVPGVLGKIESLEEKRFGVGLPVYTRPETFVFKGKKYKVPKVLLSGDHRAIGNWRKKQVS